MVTIRDDDDLPPPLPKQRITDGAGKILFECRTATYQNALVEAVAAKADLTGAAFNPDGGRFGHYYYPSLSLPKARLSESRWANCEIGATDFSGADLRGATFAGCNLSGCDFSKAKLAGANFCSSNLTDANFDGADLANARLAESIIDGATFRGAKLDGARLTEAKLGPIRESLEGLITGTPTGVQALMNAVRAGKIDGSTAEKGIIATVRNATVDYWKVQVPRGYLIDRFASAIGQGDTPASNAVSAVIEQWLADWILRDTSGFFGDRCPTCGAHRQKSAA